MNMVVTCYPCHAQRYYGCDWFGPAFSSRFCNMPALCPHPHRSPSPITPRSLVGCAHAVPWRNATPHARTRVLPCWWICCALWTLWIAHLPYCIWWCPHSPIAPFIGFPHLPHWIVDCWLCYMAHTGWWPWTGEERGGKEGREEGGKEEEGKIQLLLSVYLVP